MAVLASSDLERPAILGSGGQEQLRFEAALAPAPPPVPAARALPERAREPAGTPKRPSGELTLDELLVVAWEGVTAHHQASCPVCRGAMVPRYAAAGPERLGGRCRDCGSTLA